MPRVAIVYDVLYPWVHGGAEKRFWEIARRLPDHGFEPHLIGPKYWNGPRSMQQEGVWLHGICPPRDLYGEDGVRTIGEALAYARDLLPALLRLRVDLIDCCAFPYFPWFSARAVAQLRRIPVLTTWPELWGPYWLSYLGPVKGRLARTVEACTVQLSQSHHCLSAFTERRLHAVAPHVAITPIPAGIDAAALRRFAAPVEQRQGIVFIGRLLDHKRVSDLLQALHTIREQHPATHLTIVGRGPAESALRTTVEQLGLQQQVTFRGFLEEEALYTLLGRARCLVLPSEREGQGMVVVEAQATGTPPIVAQGPETAATDFIQHGVDGLLYPVGDTTALAQALRTVLTDDSVHHSLVQGGLETATRLDWGSVIVPRVAALYRSLYTSNEGTNPAARLSITTISKEQHCAHRH